MTWIYEALEMHDKRGRPLGKYRVVRWDAEQPDQLRGLCDHNHPSPEEALSCDAVCEFLDDQFSEIPKICPPKLS